MEKIVSNVKNIFLNGLIILFPFFFLPFTQDYFTFNKFYLLAAVAVMLLAAAGIQLLTSKKISLETKPLDLPIVLFLIFFSLSFFLQTPNKMQELIAPNFGLVLFLALTVVYFFASRSSEYWPKIYPLVSSIFSLTSIILFFALPLFTTMGNFLELIFVLGLFLAINLTVVITKKSKNLLALLPLALNVTAIGLAVYAAVSKNLVILPPLSTSWYAALETLKSVRTALIGVGLDNFPAVFNKVKDFSYNQTVFWQVPGFSFSRMTPLHIMTETGLLGLISFFLMLFAGMRLALNQKNIVVTVVYAYVAIFMVLFPPSLSIFVALFLLLGYLSSKEPAKNSHSVLHLGENPIFLGLGIFVVLAILVGSVYFLERAYAAEVYFKLAVNGLVKKDAKQVYDNMRTARILNPYSERFILNFSQTNILIANNIAQKGSSITETERQTIAQAIQASISEAKELIRLNPNKAQYFENLANIYKNIIPIAAGSDVWSISSYQRAILLDPSNPTLRLNLGGVYYLLGKYNDASRFFEQAAELKPDWQNAYYNLAWSYYQNKEYNKAALAMQNVLNLVDKEKSPEDYKKATETLNNFKNQLAEAEKQATGEGDLTLPEQNKGIDPKIKLPDEASPEAK